MRSLILLALIACQGDRQSAPANAGDASVGGSDAGRADDAGADAASVLDAATLDDAAIADAMIRDAAPRPARLALVSARDHIEGLFLTARTITADATRIYLASRGNNQLFVLGRDRAANFPLVQTVTVGVQGMSSVNAEGDQVRAISVSGELFVYAKGETLGRHVDLPGAGGGAIGDQGCRGHEHRAPDHVS